MIEVPTQCNPPGHHPGGGPREEDVVQGDLENQKFFVSYIKTDRHIQIRRFGCRNLKDGGDR